MDIHPIWLLSEILLTSHSCPSVSTLTLPSWTLIQVSTPRRSSFLRVNVARRSMSTAYALLVRRAFWSAHVNDCTRLWWRMLKILVRLLRKNQSKSTQESIYRSSFVPSSTSRMVFFVSNVARMDSTHLVLYISYPRCHVRSVRLCLSKRYATYSRVVSR